jgi:hypothetical protein
MTAYHAEAFFVMPGRCFRMVSGGDGEAGPTHCSGLHARPIGPALGAD